MKYEGKTGNIYCIPGLGVDTRIFEDLTLKPKVHMLEWIEPLPQESLDSYSKRMAAGIPVEEDFTLLGLSFGGIIAQHMAQFLKPDNLILISCIKDGSEKPFMFRLFAHIPLYKLSRGSWRIKTLPFWAPRFGIKDPEDIKFLQDMFHKASDRHRMWAIEKLANWKAIPLSLPVLHIHGEKDRVFPSNRISKAIIVKDGKSLYG